jgi:hypothetical protein
MIINYPFKYTDLKRFFLQKMIKIMHNFHEEINTKKLSDCQIISPLIPQGGTLKTFLLLAPLRFYRL